MTTDVYASRADILRHLDQVVSTPGVKLAQDDIDYALERLAKDDVTKDRFLKGFAAKVVSTLENRLSPEMKIKQAQWASLMPGKI